MIGNITSNSKSKGSSTTLPDIYLGGVSDTKTIDQLLDNFYLTVENGTIPVLFYSGSPSKGQQATIKRYLWKLGAGDFFPIGSNDFESKLELIEETFASSKIFTSLITQPNVQQVNISNLNGQNSFIDYMNLYGIYYFNDVNRTYIITFSQNGINYGYIFKGNLGNYGYNGLQFTEDDFILIYNSSVENYLSTKLDKDTTTGVERVWVYGTDGIGFFKPTSELAGFQVYKTINSNTILDNTFHNSVVWVTGNCNITIPAGLRSDFNATFRTFGSITATFLTNGTTINAQSDGTVQSPKSMSYIAQYSNNNYIISGGGLS